MNRKSLPMIITVAIVAALFSFLIAQFIFKPPPRSTTVPQVEVIKASFPDVNHDTTYSSFLNPQALDPTQTIQIGGSQNSNPF